MDIMRQQLKLNLGCVSKTQMYPSLSTLVITTSSVRVCVLFPLTNDAIVFLTGTINARRLCVFVP